MARSRPTRALAALACVAALAGAGAAQAATPTRTRIAVADGRVIVRLTPAVPGARVLLIVEVALGRGWVAESRRSVRVSPGLRGFPGPRVDRGRGTTRVTAVFGGDEGHRPSRSVRVIERARGSGRGDGGNGNGGDGGVGAGEDPVSPSAGPLLGLGVRFGPWDEATGRAGDFLLADAALAASGAGKVFEEFGAPGASGALTYQLPEGTPITAMADLLVLTSTDEGEGHALTASGGGYGFTYEHLAAPTVAPGARVEAGAVLGTAPAAPDGATLASVALAVFSVAPSGAVVFHCPLSLLAAPVKPLLTAEVAQLMRDAEALAGDELLYDEEQMVEPGCLQDALRAE